MKASHVYETVSIRATHVDTHVRAHVYTAKINDPGRYTGCRFPCGKPVRRSVVIPPGSSVEEPATCVSAGVAFAQRSDVSAHVSGLSQNVGGFGLITFG